MKCSHPASLTYHMHMAACDLFSHLCAPWHRCRHPSHHWGLKPLCMAGWAQLAARTARVHLPGSWAIPPAPSRVPCAAASAAVPGRPCSAQRGGPPCCQAQPALPAHGGKRLDAHLMGSTQQLNAKAPFQHGYGFSCSIDCLPARPSLPFALQGPSVAAVAADAGDGGAPAHKGAPAVQPGATCLQGTRGLIGGHKAR